MRITRSLLYFLLMFLVSCGDDDDPLIPRIIPGEPVPAIISQLDFFIDGDRFPADLDPERSTVKWVRNMELEFTTDPIEPPGTNVPNLRIYFSSDEVRAYEIDLDRSDAWIVLSRLPDGGGGSGVEGTMSITSNDGFTIQGSSIFSWTMMR